MVVSKITTAPTSNEVTDKINEIIDNLGGSTVDQSYDPTSSNAQSGVAIAEAGFLENKGTGTYSLGILGIATGNRGVGIGRSASCEGAYSTGIGAAAIVKANYAIQIGYGTNSTASTLSVGFNASSSANRKNWELLDGTTGLIPDARLSSNIARTSDVDEIATDLNGKADVDLTNLSVGLTNTICTTPATTTSSASSATPAVVVENYVNGTSWYRVWSDGWCEQGCNNFTAGSIGVYRTVSLLKQYKDANYSVFAQIRGDGENANIATINCEPYTNATFRYTQGFNGTYYDNACMWEAKGYIS